MKGEKVVRNRRCRIPSPAARMNISKTIKAIKEYTGLHWTFLLLIIFGSSIIFFIEKIGGFLCLPLDLLWKDKAYLVIYWITAVIIWQYTRETYLLRKISNQQLENSIEDKQPFLEIIFPNNNSVFRNTVVLKNFGQSPAYSPTIKSIEIEKNRFDFDPLKTSQLPIQPNESREVWIHHTLTTDKRKTSVGNVLPLLEKLVFGYNTKFPSNPLKIEIRCFDYQGRECERNLYIKIGGIEVKKYIYTSTSTK